MDINNNSETENNSTLASKIEALLFVHGEAIKMKKLAELLEISEEEVKIGLNELTASLNAPGRGISLMISEDKVMLVTKPELGELVKKLVSEELDAELSPASLETLSIIAYLGPISRPEIDYIRGVNSSFILRNLMVRGLVSREASKEKPGVTLYAVTFDFLRHVGVNSPKDLPEFEKYSEVMKNFAKPPESQPQPQPQQQ